MKFFTNPSCKIGFFETIYNDSFVDYAAFMCEAGRIQAFYQFLSAALFLLYPH